MTSLCLFVNLFFLAGSGGGKMCKRCAYLLPCACLLGNCWFIPASSMLVGVNNFRKFSSSFNLLEA